MKYGGPQKYRLAGRSHPVLWMEARMDDAIHILRSSTSLVEKLGAGTMLLDTASS